MSDESLPTHIARRTRVFMALRTLLLEACWNNKGKQNLGFCYSILPALKKLYAGQALNEALKRHLSAFNTNPCFSGFIAGAVIEQEAYSQTDEAQAWSRIGRMKSMLGGTFGALGDDLMWFSLKPFLGTLAVLLFLLGHEWAFVWLVGIFSAATIMLRFRGIELGLKGGAAVQQYLERIKPKRIAAALKRATCVLLGAVAGILLSTDEGGVAGCEGSWLGTALALSIIVVCFILRAKNVSSVRIGAGVCVLSGIGVVLS